MLRKFTALSLISLATLIILAHAVIPHHHHSSQICIESAFGHEHDHEQVPEDDDQGNKVNCILSQLLILPNNQDYNQILSSAGSEIRLLFHSLPFLQAPGTIQVMVHRQISEFRVWYFPELYKGFTPVISGLRAPPLG